MHVVNIFSLIKSLSFNLTFFLRKDSRIFDSSQVVCPKVFLDYLLVRSLYKSASYPDCYILWTYTPVLLHTQHRFFSAYVAQYDPRQREPT